MDNYGGMFQNNPGFVGFVRDGKIFNSTGQQVGCTTDEYNKAIQIARDYEKVLYDKGILVKPKTPEEINQELQKTLSQMQTAMNALVEKVEKLESGDEQTIRNESGDQVHGTRQSAETEQGV